jgi:hypothetical protein
MKKTILMLAFTGLVGAAFAFNGGQEGSTKKSCAKSEKACCKKGAGASNKSCDKKADKAEVKSTETKTEAKK